MPTSLRSIDFGWIILILLTAAVALVGGFFVGLWLGS